MEEELGNGGNCITCPRLDFEDKAPSKHWCRQCPISPVFDHCLQMRGNLILENGMQYNKEKGLPITHRRRVSCAML
jgi:hypothetical protein